MTNEVVVTHYLSATHLPGSTRLAMRRRSVSRRQNRDQTGRHVACLVPTIGFTTHHSSSKETDVCPETCPQSKANVPT